MNYGQVQNMVLTDAFAESKRADAKQWINSAYQVIWDAEEWSFRTATVSISVAGGSQAATGMPADFGNAIYLLHADGDPLRPIQDVRQFYALYGDTSDKADPVAFTIIGQASLIVGPTPAADETLTLVHQKNLTVLASDTDTPAFPAGYHMALVFGARMQGSALLKVPVFDAEQREYERLLQGMRMNFLSPVKGEYEQVGAFRPGY